MAIASIGSREKLTIEPQLHTVLLKMSGLRQKLTRSDELVTLQRIKVQLAVGEAM
jgi:hypothetical protein